MMLLGLLVCLSVGTMAQESPISPWQSLNSAMADPPKDEPLNTGEEFSDVPYDVTYPEGDFQNETDYQSDEELILQSLPFKLPFKMDKKQLAVSMKILKAAVKPILKSKELRDVVAYIDESLVKYKTDLETQMYVTLFLDSVQELYEGKETAELNTMVKRVFTDMSDEETARTLGSVWRSYLSPAIASYVIDPMRSYVLSPVRSYLYEPISNYVNDFAERIGTWMDGSQQSYIDVRYPDEYYRRWSDRINDFASRMSDWTSQARQGLEMARRMLEIQDEGRCYSCGDQDDHYLEEVNMYNVQVQELAWLAWLSALGLLAVAAAIAIPPSVAIPVALGAGGAGGDFTGPPDPTFVAVQVPVIGVPPPPPALPVAVVPVGATGTGVDPGTFIAADDGGFGFGPFAEPLGPGAGAGPTGGATGFGLGGLGLGGPGVVGGGATGANGFGAAPTSFIVRRRRKYSPYEHIDRSADEFDYSVLNESNTNLKFSDKGAYKEYTRYGEKYE